MNDIVNKNINLKEDKPYYIYIHTCPNYWTYVGMSQRPQTRWNNGEGYKNNLDFYKAIQLFGWENIKHEIVAQTNYRWIAQQIERSLITHYKIKGRSFNETNVEELLVEKKKKTRISKKVGQYDKKTGELIKEFSSAREARDFTGVPESGIKSNCLNKSKSSGGYVWKYL